MNGCPGYEFDWIWRTSQLDIKLLKQHTQSNCRFHQCKLISHALSRSTTKRQERKIWYDLIFANSRWTQYGFTDKRTRVYTKNPIHVTSLGYKAPGLRDGSKPAHPSIPSLFFSTKNLSGSNSSGLSHKNGDLWRLYTYNVNFKRVSPRFHPTSRDKIQISSDRIFSYTTQLAYMSSHA